MKKLLLALLITTALGVYAQEEEWTNHFLGESVFESHFFGENDILLSFYGNTAENKGYPPTKLNITNKEHNWSYLKSVDSLKSSSTFYVEDSLYVYIHGTGNIHKMVNGQLEFFSSTGLTKQQDASMVKCKGIYFFNGRKYNSYPRTSTWNWKGIAIDEFWGYNVINDTLLFARQQHKLHQFNFVTDKWDLTYTFPLRSKLRSFYMKDSTGFIGVNQYLHRTTNGGTQWSQLTTSLTNHIIFISKNPSTGSLIVSDGRSYITSEDNGETWKQHQLTQGQIIVNRFIQGKNGVVVGTGVDGAIIRSSDYGLTWEVVNYAVSGNISGVSKLRPNLLYCGSGQMFSSNNGNTWKKTLYISLDTATAATDNINNITFTHEGVVARDTKNNYFFSTDGETWITYDENTHGKRNTMYQVGKDFIVYYRSPNLYYSTDWGKTETVVKTSNFVDFDNAIRALNGIIEHSSDQGNSWTTVYENIPSGNMSSLSFLGETVTYSNGFNHYKSLDKGKTWTEVGTTSVGLKSKISPSGEGYGGGTENNSDVIYKTDDFGATWTLDSLSNPRGYIVTNSMSYFNNRFFLGANQGRLWYKNDSNSTIDGVFLSRNEKLIKLSPNPVSDVLMIETTSPYSVYSINGTLIEENDVTPLNVSDYTSGLYFIKTEDGYTGKFIVE